MNVPMVGSPPSHRNLPAGGRIRLDPRVRLWAGGQVLIGGSPWRVSRLAPVARDFVRQLVRDGPAGTRLSSAPDRAVARVLIDRGFAILTTEPHHLPSECPVVVPAMDRPASLDRCLASLARESVHVVDDASTDSEAIAAVTAAHGAHLHRHTFNQGPAAARNTGLNGTTGEFVAFLDSDCVAPPGWAGRMLHHFDDPAVAAVAPRVVPSPPVSSVLERYEASRSSLDMGRHPELVRPRSRLGFVPSAALIVRREALGASGFDQDLRLGEDVDLVWRLAEAGWHVRYDPTVTVSHETRARPSQWLRRRYDYGTSAAALERRHPGNLAPARVSAWNLATLGLVAARRPLAAASVSVAAVVALTLRIRSLPRGPQLAGRVVLQGFVADGASIGHLLRREWWPVGCAALLLSPRSRTARTLVACMLGPIAWEWLTTDTRLDPVRYTALRLLDDAAYGTGVIASSVTSRVAAPLVPRVRLPEIGNARVRLPGVARRPEARP